MFSLWGLGTSVPGQIREFHLLAGAGEEQNQISASQLPRNLYVIVLTLVAQLAAWVYYYWIIDASALSSWRWALFTAAPWACLVPGTDGHRIYLPAFIWDETQLARIHQLGLCQDVWSLCFFVFGVLFVCFVVVGFGVFCMVTLDGCAFTCVPGDRSAIPSVFVLLRCGDGWHMVGTQHLLIHEGRNKLWKIHAIFLYNIKCTLLSYYSWKCRCHQV